ncbi:hypothetical protein GCM10008955_02590 [Deinococcus malanensis]|uniref:Uncharacterized protein n=1 Tax=Deinococcus malanensis TaxID=1706855 RepID=A0ABQ2EIF2_9DEIO|nr:hypothetical protein [Deinococcus malanensis]GGK12772.1 hypothetical protein GCM10008955_02590 [Deinococcus malanensis]
MIKYRKQNALEPEKDAEISVNLVPLLSFVVGFLITQVLLSTVLESVDRI